MTTLQISRKERERDQRRQEILSVALSLFSKRGFKSVSMQEIAEASEYAVGTLYNLFDGKDAMLEEIFAKSSTQVKEAVLGILDEPGTVVHKLRLLFQRLPEILEPHTDFMRLVVAEMGQTHHSHTRLDQHENDMRAYEANLSELIADGIQCGVLRTVDPDITTKAISSLVETLVFEMKSEFSKNEMAVMLKKAERLFVDGLLLKRDCL